MAVVLARRPRGWLLAGALLALAGAIGAGPAAAQAYPTRPVRFVVPFPPGNAADITARILAGEVQQRLGHAIVVENRAGASGALGVQAAARAAPDGYTLLLSSLSPIVVNPALTRTLPYDPRRDLAPIGLVGWTGYLLVVSPDFPAATVAEAVAALRAAPPGRFSAGHPGTGTVSHLTTELFMLLTGTRLETVPYRGSGQALLDVASGRVQIMIDAMTSALPQAQAGRVRPLAAVSPQRSALAPDIPSMGEAGVPELARFEALAWTGLLGPAQTPPEVVAWWSRELNGLLADPAVARRFAAQNLEVAPPGPPSRFAEVIASDLAKWSRVVADARIEPAP